MNASTRWATHFVEALECVKCRTKENLKLYYFNGKLVEPEGLTIEQLHGIIPKVDVWCDACVSKPYKRFVTTWVAGPGRLRHKEEAVFIADVHSKLEVASIFDEYVIENGKTITKKELVDAVKNRPCALCKQSFPRSVMEFHHLREKRHNISTMEKSQHCTIRQLIDEIEKCTLLCATCHRLVKYEGVTVSKETIRLDRNFFNSIVKTKV